MSVIDKRVVNIDELKLEHFAKGDKFACDAVRIGPLLGAKDLGYSYDVVPPGKRSCPFHSHRGEEEMFFIVKGDGYAALRRGHAKDPRGRHHLLPDGRAGDGAPDHQRFGRGTRVPVGEHDAAGRHLRVSRFEEDRRLRGGLRHMTRREHHLDYWTDEV